MPGSTRSEFSPHPLALFKMTTLSFKSQLQHDLASQIARALCESHCALRCATLETTFPRRRWCAHRVKYAEQLRSCVLQWSRALLVAFFGGNSCRKSKFSDIL